MSAGNAADAAIAYAYAGWPVFPCKPGSKEPATPHGFKDATTDFARIDRWWADNPARNIAIATGAPGPDVLDVDVHPDGDGWAAFNRLKRAGLLAGAMAIVRTRSGGLHAYFAGTGQPCGRLPRHHLDFKAAGGYVLAPPSWVGADDRGPGGRYEVLDHRAGTTRLDWQAARELLDPRRAATPRMSGGSGDAAKLGDWVARQPKGNRNHALFWAACRAAESGADPEPLVAAAVAAGLPEHEARRTVASAGRRTAS